jgi:hypothetical protein
VRVSYPLRISVLENLVSLINSILLPPSVEPEGLLQCSKQPTNGQCPDHNKERNMKHEFDIQGSVHRSMTK